MSPVIPVSSSRVSDLLVRERLLRQIQSGQAEMLQVQMQLSTGRRISIPSEDAPAALRAMSLQRLLERKDQVQTNLITNQSYLSATDSALMQVSNSMAEARGMALSVVGTTSSDTQRDAVIQELDQILLQLSDVGNQKFRGRYLFAGTGTTVRPFERTDDSYIQYNGNEGRLSSFSDIDLMFDTNLHGDEVFGALSEPVRGSIDLNPVVTYQTRLADLRGGRGITDGSISVTDGNATTIVDLSSAETVGDVAALLMANPPLGRSVVVEITPTGLQIELDPPAAGDAMVISDVGEGSTATELGIRTASPAGSGPVVASDLNPILRKTTPLTEILGSRAFAVVRSGGSDNDLIFEADTNGTTLNGVNIVFADTATEGNETVAWDGATKTLTVGIESGLTMAHHVVTAVNAAQVAGTIDFTARLEPIDDYDGGKGLIDVTVTETTYGGAGTDFDRTSGIQILNGDTTYTIDFAGDVTVEDMLNTLNGSGAGVVAQINDDATGIDVRSRLSGADFAIGENGGNTATQLGLRTFTPDTRLEDLNLGRGIFDHEGSGTFAAATWQSAGADNGLILRARQDGAAWNGFTVSFIDSGGAAGSEALTYDAAGKTITFEIVPGSTTAADVVQLFEATPAAKNDFEISLDAGDGTPNDGTGTVDLGSVATGGGVDGAIDFTIQRKDGTTLQIDIAGLETIGQLLDRINTHADNTGNTILAQLATYGNGIELVDNHAGTYDVTVARAQLSTAAIELGLIPEGAQTSNSPTPGAVATATVSSPGTDNDLLFQAIDLGPAANGLQVIIEDNLLGPGNETFTYDPAAGTMTFGIDPGTTTANMLIPLFQADPAASALLSIGLSAPDGGVPNTGIGLVAVTAAPVTVGGGISEILTGTDVNPQEVEGIYTALIRLKEALRANDVWQVQRAIEMLDEKTIDMNFSRAELGARQQGLDGLQVRLETEEIGLRETLSIEIDVDMAEAISQLTGKQATYQAALQSSGLIFQMTLLDYL